MHFYTFAFVLGKALDVWLPQWLFHLLWYGFWFLKLCVFLIPGVAYLVACQYHLTTPYPISSHPTLYLCWVLLHKDWNHEPYQEYQLSELFFWVLKDLFSRGSFCPSLSFLSESVFSVLGMFSPLAPNWLLSIIHCHTGHWCNLSDF